MGLWTKLSEENGQAAPEYALVVALTAIVLVLALAVIPGNLFGSFWQTVEAALP